MCVLRDEVLLWLHGLALNVNPAILSQAQMSGTTAVHSLHAPRPSMVRRTVRVPLSTSPGLVLTLPLSLLCDTASGPLPGTSVLQPTSVDMAAFKNCSYFLHLLGSRYSS